MWQTLIGNYVSFFTLLPHTPPLFLKTWKIRILIKQKTIAGDIIILHMCTKNHNHMRYGSWDTEWNRGLFVILDNFLPFSPLRTQKIKILKTEKNTWRYHHFTLVYHKWRSYDVQFLIYGAQHTIFCHFGPVFSLLHP